MGALDGVPAVPSVYKERGGVAGRKRVDLEVTAVGITTESEGRKSSPVLPCLQTHRILLVCCGLCCNQAFENADLLTLTVAGKVDIVTAIPNLGKPRQRGAKLFFFFSSNHTTWYLTLVFCFLRVGPTL